MAYILHNNTFEVLKAWIVLPTYNEALNITRTLNKIMVERAILRKENILLSVLVVDDSSPDNTSGIVQEYQKANKGVDLLVRKEKNGLGAAYIEGMIHALSTHAPDVILEMDADGQHNPKDIVRLLQAIQQGADFAIGSRYTQGGSVPENWSVYRKVVSRSANIYARTMLDTGGAKDCTGGFRAIRASLLEKINLSTLDIKGYAFQVTLLNAAARAGAKIVEVPIEFHEREQGYSKMNPIDMVTGGIGIAGIRVQQIMGVSSDAGKIS